MKEKGRKGIAPHGKTAPIFEALKWSAFTSPVPFVISWFTTWTYSTLLLGLVLLLSSISFRLFKWWVYRGTRQMGKKRYMKRTSLTTSLDLNQKKRPLIVC